MNHLHSWSRAIYLCPKETHISETSRNWKMLKKYDPPKNWKIMGVLLLKRFQIMTHWREKYTFSASFCVDICLLLVYSFCNVWNVCLNDQTNLAWFTSIRGVYQLGHLDHFWRIVKQFIYKELLSLDILTHLCMIRL